MKMRSLVVVVIAFALVLGGCVTEGTYADAPVNIVAIRGPSSLGMLRLMEESELGQTLNNYNFEIVAMPDAIPSLIVRGEADIAAVPVNMSSILYSATDGDVLALVVATMGVLHIVDTTGEIGSIEDLRGRTIFASARGATPEFILNYVLNMNGLVPDEDVYIDWRADHAEIAALLQHGQAQIAMLPEPFVSTVLAQIDGLNVALDLTEEWNRVQPDYGLVMTAVIGRREFVEANPEALAIFLEEYARSIEFMNTHTEAAAALAVAYEIIPNPAIAAQAIPRSNVVFITGEQMQRYLQGMLTVLYNENPGSVGGALPGDDFFFIPDAP